MTGRAPKMFGEWWIKHLERQAAEQKLDAFIAGLEPDERALVFAIMRDRAAVEARDLAVWQRQLDRQMMSDQAAGQLLSGPFGNVFGLR